MPGQSGRHRFPIALGQEGKTSHSQSLRCDRNLLLLYMDFSFISCVASSRRNSIRSHITHALCKQRRWCGRPGSQPHVVLSDPICKAITPKRDLNIRLLFQISSIQMAQIYHLERPFASLPVSWQRIPNAERFPDWGYLVTVYTFAQLTWLLG